MSANTPDQAAKLTDIELAYAIDCALSDYSLATRYKHNASQQDDIRSHLDMLYDEKRRRGSNGR